MVNSNYTLRFPRSYREATGTDAHFEQFNPDRLVGLVVLCVCCIALGMWIGGAV